MCRALVSFDIFADRADNVTPCDEPCAVFPALRFLRTHNFIEDGEAAVGRRSNGRYPLQEFELWEISHPVPLNIRRSGEKKTKTGKIFIPPANRDSL